MKRLLLFVAILPFVLGVIAGRAVAQDLPSMTREEVIYKMNYAKFVHDRWADYLEEHSVPIMGTAQWHRQWSEIYRNVIYHLRHPEE